jgi:hypothetical protein
VTEVGEEEAEAERLGWHLEAEALAAQPEGRTRSAAGACGADAAVDAAGAAGARGGKAAEGIDEDAQIVKTKKKPVRIDEGLLGSSKLSKGALSIKELLVGMNETVENRYLRHAKKLGAPIDVHVKAEIIKDVLKRFREDFKRSLSLKRSEIHAKRYTPRCAAEILRDEAKAKLEEEVLMSRLDEFLDGAFAKFLGSRRGFEPGSFTCEHKCGFSGGYGAVAKHELLCSRNPSPEAVAAQAEVGMGTPSTLEIDEVVKADEGVKVERVLTAPNADERKECECGRLMRRRLTAILPDAEDRCACGWEFWDAKCRHCDRKFARNDRDTLQKHESRCTGKHVSSKPEKCSVAIQKRDTESHAPGVAPAVAGLTAGWDAGYRQAALGVLTGMPGVHADLRPSPREHLSERLSEIVRELQELLRSRIHDAGGGTNRGQ